MMYGLAWHCGDDTDEYNGEPHYPRRGRAAATGSVAHGIHVESSIVPALHYSGHCSAIIGPGGWGCDGP